MSKAATVFNRELDERINGPKSRELHAYGIPCLWIVISPVEAQCLRDGLVPTAVMEQAARVLSPDPLIDPEAAV